MLETVGIQNIAAETASMPTALAIPWKKRQFIMNEMKRPASAKAAEAAASKVPKFQGPARSCVPEGGNELRIQQSLRRTIRGVEIHSRKLSQGHSIFGPQEPVGTRTGIDHPCLRKVVDLMEAGRIEAAPVPATGSPASSSPTNAGK